MCLAYVLLVAGVCVCFAQTPREYLAEAKFYFDKKYYQQAIIACKKAIEGNPGYAPVYVLLGQIYTQIDDYGEAEKAFKQALKFSPRNFDAYINFGHLYRKRGNLKWAAWLYHRALKINPASPISWSALADIAKDQGKLYSSIKLYKYALERAPNDVHILLKISSLYFEKLNDINTAKFYCKRAIKVATNNKDRDQVRIQLASLHEFEGNLHEAISQLHKITQPSTQTKAQLAQLYMQVKKFDKARQLYLKLLAGHNDWDWYLSLARLAEKTNNYTDAFKYYDHLVKTTDEELVYLSAAQFLIKAKKIALEDKNFDIIPPYHPLRQTVADYLQDVFDVYRQYGEKFTSYYFIKLASSISPQNHQLRLALGNSLRDLNFADSAVQQYRLAIELEPNFKDAEDELERILFELEDSLKKKYDIDLAQLKTPSLPTLALSIWPRRTQSANIADIFEDYLGNLMGYVSKVVYLPRRSKLDVIIQQNKKLNADYILLCELKEDRRGLAIDAKLYDSKTLREVGDFYSYKEGKLKVTEALFALFHKMRKYLKPKGTIIKLIPNVGVIVNLGQRYNISAGMHLETENLIELKVIQADEYISLCEVIDRKQIKFIKKFQTVSIKPEFRK